jgi:antitoxin YefM
LLNGAYPAHIRREGLSPRDDHRSQDPQGEIVVTRKSKPVPALVNHAEYERLKGTVDVLSDPVLMRQIRASRRYFVKGRRGLSFEDVFGEPIAPAKRRVR